MFHGEEWEVLKCLFIYEKAGVKGRHTRARVHLENERSEQKENFRMPQREQLPSQHQRKYRTLHGLTCTRTATVQTHFLSPKWASWSATSYRGSCWQMQVLPNPHIAQVSYGLFAYQVLSWTITEKTPGSGNGLLTAFQGHPSLQLKWTLGSELKEDGLTLRI